MSYQGQLFAIEGVFPHYVRRERIALETFLGNSEEFDLPRLGTPAAFMVDAYLQNPETFNDAPLGVAHAYSIERKNLARIMRHVLGRGVHIVMSGSLLSTAAHRAISPESMCELFERIRSFEADVPPPELTFVLDFPDDERTISNLVAYNSKELNRLEVGEHRPDSIQRTLRAYKHLAKHFSDRVKLISCTQNGILKHHAPIHQNIVDLIRAF